MTRRTQRFATENLEARAMMAADMGFAATIDLPQESANTAVAAETTRGEQGPWVCGVDTSGIKSTIDSAHTSEVSSGDTPLGSEIGSADAQAQQQFPVRPDGGAKMTDTLAVDLSFADY